MATKGIFRILRNSPPVHSENFPDAKTISAVFDKRIAVWIRLTYSTKSIDFFGHAPLQKVVRHQTVFPLPHLQTAGRKPLVLEILSLPILSPTDAHEHQYRQAGVGIQILREEYF